MSTLNSAIAKIDEIDLKSDIKNHIKDGKVNKVYLEIGDEMEKSGYPYIAFYNSFIPSFNETAGHCLDFYYAEGDKAKILLNNDMQHFSLLIYNQNATMSKAFKNDNSIHLLDLLYEHYSNITILRQNQLNELSNYFIDIYHKLADVSFSNLSPPKTKDDLKTSLQKIIDEYYNIEISSVNPDLLALQQKHIDEIIKTMDNHIENVCSKI
jgi:hypothetical protein